MTNSCWQIQKIHFAGQAINMAWRWGSCLCSLQDYQECCFFAELTKPGSSTSQQQYMEQSAFKNFSFWNSLVVNWATDDSWIRSKRCQASFILFRWLSARMKYINMVKPSTSVNHLLVLSYEDCKETIMNSELVELLLATFGRTLLVCWSCLSWNYCHHLLAC